MATRHPKVAVGVFHSPEAARKAVDELVKAGFTEAQIGVAGRHAAVKKGKGMTGGEGALAGATAGAMTGAGVGALWALGIAAGMLPAIGPVIAGGLLASVLASAAGGAAVAGLVGALVGLGLSEEDARYYEGEFKEGRKIVTVKANARYTEAVEILTRHGGYSRETAPVAGGLEAGLASKTTEETGTVELKHEKARARKTPVKKGEVRVRKEVITEQESISVPVEREEVVIERKPARRRRAAASEIKSEEIRIPVKEEVVNVEKEVVVDQEVKVGNRKVRGQKNVTTPVRREKLKVEQEGETHVTQHTESI